MPDPDTGEPVWFRPDPRAIIPLDRFHTSKSLLKVINKNIFKVSINQEFLAVMKGCADRPETWINQEFLDTYFSMHRQGIAHSVEVWQNKELVGGLYGVAIGGAFFAESMYHRATNASKVALYFLVGRLRERGFELLECQFLTSHLASLGAISIPDTEYIKRLAHAIELPCRFL